MSLTSATLSVASRIEFTFPLLKFMPSCKNDIAFMVERDYLYPMF